MLALRTSALRPILPAILALVGTAASFGITAAPVRAAAPGAFYTVTLAVPLAAPAKMVEGETLWTCAGSDTPASAGGRRACARGEPGSRSSARGGRRMRRGVSSRKSSKDGMLGHLLAV